MVRKWWAPSMHGRVSLAPSNLHGGRGEALLGLIGRRGPFAKGDSPNGTRLLLLLGLGSQGYGSFKTGLALQGHLSAVRLLFDLSNKSWHSGKFWMQILTAFMPSASSRFRALLGFVVLAPIGGWRLALQVGARPHK